MANLPVELSRLLEATDDASRRAAWEGFVGTHSLLLLGAARARGDSYEVVMDRYAFVLDRLRDDDFLWLRSYALNPSAKFASWLAAVACRLCTDHYWSQYRRANGDESDWPQRQDAARQRLMDAVMGRMRSPHSGIRGDRALTRTERMARFNRAMEKLSNRDRLLLAMRFESGTPVSEIAEAMAFPSKHSVRKRLQQVRSDLRHDLRRANAA